MAMAQLEGLPCPTCGDPSPHGGQQDCPGCEAADSIRTMIRWLKDALRANEDRDYRRSNRTLDEVAYEIEEAEALNRQAEGK